MALTAPAQLSSRSGALIPHGIYCSGLGKVFAVWTIDTPAGSKFIAQRHDLTTSFELPVAADYVTAFDIAEAAADQAAVFYSTQDSVKYFVFDFASSTLVTDTTVLQQGQAPALLPNLLFLYVRSAGLRFRKGLAGTDQPLLSSPNYALSLQDDVQKAPHIFRYLGLHSHNSGVALPLRVGASPVFLHSCRDAAGPGLPLTFTDKTGNTKHLVVTANAVPFTGYGLVALSSIAGSITNWNASAGAISIEGKLIPEGLGPTSTILAGNVSWGFDAADKAWFGYFDGTYTHYLSQERLEGLKPGFINMVGIRHVWGNKASSAIVVNGTSVPVKWRSTIPYLAGTSGSILSFADLGGGFLQVTTSGAHGLSNGAVVTISATANYNGVYIISGASGSLLTIRQTWVVSEAGNWSTANDDHAQAGGTYPWFTTLTSTLGLRPGDVLVEQSVHGTAVSVADLVDRAYGRL